MAFQPGPGIVLRQAKVQAIPDLGALVVRDALTQAEYESFRDALPTGGPALRLWPRKPQMWRVEKPPKEEQSTVEHLKNTRPRPKYRSISSYEPDPVIPSPFCPPLTGADTGYIAGRARPD